MLTLPLVAAGYNICYNPAVVTLKVRKFGNSLGVILPQELIAILRVKEGEALFASEGPNSGIELSAYDPEVARQLEVAEQVMREDREVLRKLAQ